jgi:hypothetical protein
MWLAMVLLDALTHLWSFMGSEQGAYLAMASEQHKQSFTGELCSALAC